MFLSIIYCYLDVAVNRLLELSKQNSLSPRRAICFSICGYSELIHRQSHTAMVGILVYFSISSATLSENIINFKLRSVWIVAKSVKCCGQVGMHSHL